MPGFKLTISVHLIGAPLALIESDYAHRSWTRFRDIPALQRHEVQFIPGSVQSINCEAKTAYIRRHDASSTIETTYDYFVAATGLRREWPTVPQSFSEPAYLQEAQGHIDSVRKAEHGVVVIGGGQYNLHSVL
jgi:NADH dehydrogenase FAD-containing subunit